MVLQTFIVHIAAVMVSYGNFLCFENCVYFLGPLCYALLYNLTDLKNNLRLLLVNSFWIDESVLVMQQQELIENGAKALL